MKIAQPDLTQKRYILTEDVTSMGYRGKKKEKVLYGKKGQEILIVSEHDNVHIAYSIKTRELFPINPSQYRDK
jgi:hypothetical protein